VLVGVPDVVVVDPHDSYTWNLVHLVASVTGELPTVVGGDFNLTFGGSPDVQDCVPTGWYRKGDGDVQHVIATDSFLFDSTEETSLEFTDHPAWLVRMFAP
jgi:hypothetical protein